MCTSVFAQGVAPQTFGMPRATPQTAPQATQPYVAGDNIINYVDFSFNLAKWVSNEGINSSMYLSGSHYFNDLLGVAAVIEMLRGTHAGNSIGVALSVKYPIDDGLQGYALGGISYLSNPDAADSALGLSAELGVRFLLRGLYIKCSARYISADSEYQGRNVNLSNISMMAGLGVRFY
jgi:hypothetical protein